ncbi:sel1 repeat family protein [Psychrobacter sp. HII-4]|uniref:sel1 repeat family protein n=1 Tax=Psychrobacter sp. HII-4 TaxID=1569264 RepID=UPI00191AE81A|nr:sel1 repeat family protein [Psychrobacter sp. HII-4]
MKNKITGLLAALILSLTCITIGCSASDTVITTEAIGATEPASIVHFDTANPEKEAINFIRFLEETEDPKRFQIECDQKNITKSCYYFASYHEIITEDITQAYGYYKKAFDLGLKQTGFFIAKFQIFNPELFDDDNRLTIDENINYLKQASDAGSPDATRLLMLIYRKPEYNRVDYVQAEYYNKLAIKQNVKYSRYTLAFLYTHHLKDKSKIDDSIELYKDDLLAEKNWESSTALSGIYLNPEEFGSELNYVKALAYAYVTRDIRKDIVNDPANEMFENVEDDLIELLPRSLTPDQLEQAKVLYLEITEKMNSQSTSKQST